MGFIQSLSVGGEAGEAEKQAIVNLVDPLEIGGDCLKLNSEPAIAGYGEAVLPHHSNQSRSIVLENLRTKANRT